MEKVFPYDCVKKETLQVIQRFLGNDRFEEFIKNRGLPVLMKHGCY